eukprot:2479090-Alexandrium_andersonii.AAC.1
MDDELFDDAEGGGAGGHDLPLGAEAGADGYDEDTPPAVEGLSGRGKGRGRRGRGGGRGGGRGAP